jgi:hypothetical protein
VAGAAQPDVGGAIYQLWGVIGRGHVELMFDADGLLVNAKDAIVESRHRGGADPNGRSARNLESRLSPFWLGWVPVGVQGPRGMAR